MSSLRRRSSQETATDQGTSLVFLAHSREVFSDRRLLRNAGPFKVAEPHNSRLPRPKLHRADRRRRPVPSLCCFRGVFRRNKGHREFFLETPESLVCFGAARCQNFLEGAERSVVGFLVRGKCASRHLWVLARFWQNLCWIQVAKR